MKFSMTGQEKGDCTQNYYISHNKVVGGILVSPCPSVRL